MSDSAPLTKFPLDGVYGALLIAAFISCAIWGASCGQVYAYHKHNFDDSLFTRGMVVFLWFLNTFCTIETLQPIYDLLVTSFGDYARLTTGARPVLGMAFPATQSSQNFIIRGLYIHRIWYLSNKNLLLVIFLSTLSLFDLAVGFATTIKEIGHSGVTQTEDSFITLLHVYTAAQILADASVTAAQCYFLYKSRTGLRRTTKLLNILILYTINTSMIVAICATMGQVMQSIFPHSLWGIPFHYQMTKLYFLCYMTLLNAREELRNNMNMSLSFNLPTTDLPVRREDKLTLELETAQQTGTTVQSMGS